MKDVTISNYGKNVKRELYLLDGHCPNAMVDEGIEKEQVF